MVSRRSNDASSRNAQSFVIFDKFSSATRREETSKIEKILIQHFVFCSLEHEDDDVDFPMSLSSRHPSRKGILD